MSSNWNLTFDDPIPLPDGRELVTLADAGRYIASLPEAEQDAPEWREAVAALTLVVERGGDTLVAGIAIMRAITLVGGHDY